MFKMLKYFFIINLFFAVQVASASIAEDCKNLFIKKTDLISQDPNLKFVLNPSVKAFEAYDIFSQDLKKIAELFSSMNRIANNKDCSVDLSWRSREVNVQSEAKIIAMRLWQWEEKVKEKIAEVQTPKIPPTDASYSWKTKAVLTGSVVAILVIAIATYCYLNSEQNVVVGEDLPVGGDPGDLGVGYLAGTPDPGTPPIILDNIVDPLVERTLYNDAARYLNEVIGGFGVQPYSASNHLNQMGGYTDFNQQCIERVVAYMRDEPNQSPSYYRGAIRDHRDHFYPED